MFAEVYENRQLWRNAGINVALNSSQRNHYIDVLLALDGLSHICEDPHAAYCPVSLTATPRELKPFVAKRQSVLKDILSYVGITAYDPESAPYSPDRDLSADPNEVYHADSGKIVGSRFFIGHNILPSPGFGVETQKAVQFNRIAVMLMDANIRVSRMQPHRTIYLQYDNFEGQKYEFISAFQLLKQFEPGMGFHDGIPVLLGFDQNGSVFDLEELVYTIFPNLQYRYNGTTPILQLRAENPWLFYETVQ